MNLYACVKKPTTLHHLMKLKYSNYSGMRALSLAGEANPAGAPQCFHPPYKYYFFTNPVEYFISFARYVVYHIQVAKEDVATETVEKKRTLLNTRIKQLESVVEVSQIVGCNTHCWYNANHIL